MLSSFRALLVRLLVPARWGSDPGHAARALKRFGDVEADSAWQYLCALDHCRDTAVRRMLFENVLEEFKHADAFYGAAHTLATQRLHGGDQRRTCLTAGPSDLPRFLAYAHVCEEAIHGQFDSYASACHLPAVSQVFRDISADEATHGSETLRHLERLAGSPAAAQRQLVRARLQRVYEAWMRFAARLGNVTFYPVLALLFFAFGALLRRPPEALSAEGLPSPMPAPAAQPGATLGRPLNSMPGGVGGS
jgi:hypothetical protein